MLRRALLLVLLFWTAAVAEEVRYPRKTLTVSGHIWDYYYAPKDPPSTPKELPLVILLHGAGGSGGGYLARTGWGRRGSQRGYLVVAPSGQPSNPDKPADFQSNPRVWNSGASLIVGSQRSKINDWEFFEALLDDVSKQWSVDQRRVYVVGHSNGGAMAFALARHWPGRFAGIASAMSLPPELSTSQERPIATFCIFGSEDTVIPLAGGESSTPWGSRTLPPVRQRLDRWASSTGHEWDKPPAWTEEPNHLKRIVYGADFQVLLWLNQGHSWPGWEGPSVGSFGPIRTDLSAVDQILDFFESQSQR